MILAILFRLFVFVTGVSAAITLCQRWDFFVPTGRIIFGFIIFTMATLWTISFHRKVWVWWVIMTSGFIAPVVVLMTASLVLHNSNQWAVTLADALLVLLVPWAVVWFAFINKAGRAYYGRE
jgi:hypothetical protein